MPFDISLIEFDHSLIEEFLHTLQEKLSFINDVTLPN